MALRFQEKDDCDQAAKEKRETGGLLILGVLVAVIDGVSALLRGEGLASYGKDLGYYIVFGFVSWLIVPFYYEFRFRTKETYGKVSAIEKALIVSKEDHAELLERLTAIDKKLDALRLESDQS